MVRGCRLIGLLAALLAAVAPAQDPAALPSGSPEILREMLAAYAKVVVGAEPGARDPKRAVQIERELSRFEWKQVDVPAVVLEFARDQERKLRANKPADWGFDALPPGIVKLAPSEQWADLIEQGVQDLVKSLGFATWKKLSGRKGSDQDVAPRGAAFIKVCSTVVAFYSRNGGEIPERVLARIRDALYSLYATYDLDTVQKSWEYGLIPAGWFLQYGAWIGDLRSLSRATAMVDQWLADPKDGYLKNLEQAVIAIDRFTLGFAPHMGEVKLNVLRRIRASPKIPDSVKAVIKTSTR